MISQQDAADKLLDLVRPKLVGNDGTAFDHLVSTLVQTEQLDCARKLDEQLTEQYRQDRARKHG